MDSVVIDPLVKSLTAAVGYNTYGATNTDAKAYETRGERAVDIAKFALPGVVAGFADTVTESLGIYDEGEFADDMKNLYPKFGDYYANNKEILQTAGDIAGMFIPGMAAVKSLRVGSALHKLVTGGRKASLLNNVFSDVSRYDAALRAVRMRDNYLAERGVRTILTDTRRSELAQGALTINALNRVKETLAFEAAVLGTMSASDTLYPEDFSTMDYLAFAAGPIVAVEGAGLLMAKRALRQSAQNVGLAMKAELANNPSGLPLGDKVYRPGERDLGLSVDAIYLNQITKELSTTQDNIRADVLGKLAVDTEARMKRQLELMARDKPTEMAKSHALSETQLNTALSALKENPYSFVGVSSIENMPEHFNDILGVIQRKNDLIKKKASQIDEIYNANGGLLSGTLPEKELAKVQKLQEERNALFNTEFYVVEPTGEIVPGANRHNIFQDSNANKIHIQAKKGGKDKKAVASVPADPVTGIQRAVVGFTEDGQLIIPEREIAQQKEIIVNNINLTRVLSREETAQGLQEQFKRYTLQDYGREWASRVDEQMTDVANITVPGMNQDVKKYVATQLRAWEGDSGHGDIRKLFNPTANLNEMQQAQRDAIYAYGTQIRKRLAEIAGPGGTIPLFRGERYVETNGPTNDIVSMTADFNVAKNFSEGENIIVRWVPVEDVIGVVGKSFGGREVEYIVKGNLQRNADTDQVFEKISEPVKDFDALSNFQKTAIWASINRLYENYKPGSNKFLVTNNDHFTKMDYILELYGRHGNQMLKDVQFPHGVQSVDDLEWISLKSKYAAFYKMKTLKDYIIENDKVLKIPENYKINDEDIRKALNLPGTADGSVHPVYEAFLQIFANGDTVLENAVKNMDHFKTMINTNVTKSRVPYEQLGINYRGNMVKLDMRKQTPAFLHKKKLDFNQFKDEAIISKTAQQRRMVEQYLGKAGAENAELVAILHQIMFAENGRANHLMPHARKVGTLMDGQQTGTGTVTQFSFATGDGEIPSIRAALDVTGITNRAGEEWLANLYKQYDPIFQQLRSPTNKASMDQLAIYIHARRLGWEVAEFPVFEDGKYLFPLETSGSAGARNKQLWQERFGTTMPEEATMPASTRGNPTPVSLDDLSFAGANAIAELGKKALDNSNHIRRTVGLRGLNLRNWWVPPRNLSRQDTTFILDAQDNLVEIVTGRTAADAASKAERARATLQNANPKNLYRIAEQNDIENYFRLQDEAFVKLQDYTDPLRITGRPQGRVSADVIELGPEILQDVTQSLNKQFQSVIRRTRAIAFESELNYVRSMHETTSHRGASGDSVFQQYAAAVYGNQTLNPTQTVGKIYNTLETTYDNLLNAIFDKKASLFTRTTLTNEQRREYDRLVKSYGINADQYNPFQDAVDFASKTHKYNIPPSMKQHMAKLNSFTAFLALRFMDIGFAVLNMAGLMATYAPVVRSLKKLPTETIEQWQARIGAYGTTVSPDAAVFSPHKAAVDAVHWMFSEEGKNILGKYAAQGEFHHDIAELQRTLSITQTGAIEGILNKYGRFTTALADKSEEYSRMIAWAMGYRIGTKGLNLNENMASVMARRFSNQMVGDYQPNNRPRIFQGAVGMPVGLFMTYMWNYYQRVFSYIQNGQTRALVSQYAAQASIFGAQTVPGFEQYMNMFASNYDLSSNPIDGFNNRFGPVAGDIFWHGTLSNIPRLFGADDGIALYTRGDVNVRNLPLLSAPPSWSVFTNIYEALGKSTAMLKENGFSGQQTLEILANYSMNRPIRNLAELAMGESVDKRGQLIDSDVYTGLGIAARLMGLRTQQTQNKIEALYRTRMAESARGEKMANLRLALRANIREGKLSKDDLEDFVGSYFKAGGDPENFGRFIASQAMSAKVDRNARELIKALNDPTRGVDVQRFLNAESSLLNPE